MDIRTDTVMDIHPVVNILTGIISLVKSVVNLIVQNKTQFSQDKAKIKNYYREMT